MVARRAWWRAVPVVVALSGCKKEVPPPVPVVEEGEVVRMLRERPVPDPVQARFTIKMRSEPLGIAAPRLGGGLIVDRPDRAYLAVLDPLGSEVLTLTTDGERVVFMNNRDRQFVTQENAAATLGQATEGALGLGDALGMLLGLLPIDEAQVVERENLGTQERLTFRGAGGLTVVATVDPATATPRHVEVDDRKGTRTLNADYAPFTNVGGMLLPSSVYIEVPSVELTVDVEFKSWKPIDRAPDVFSPRPPDRYEVIGFDEFVERTKARLGEGASPGAGDGP